MLSYIIDSVYDLLITAINNSSDPGYGLALLDATTAQLLPTPVNSLIRNAGRYGAIYDIAGREIGRASCRERV